MSDSSEKALTAIVRVAKTNVDMLLDATTRPEVSVAGLKNASLEVLLEALASSAGAVIGDPAIPESTRAELKAFADVYAEYQRRTISVQDHFGELAKGWKCSACQRTNPRDATITGVQRGDLSVELVCRSCGAATSLTAEGKAALKRIFGGLIAPSWNPTANGFIWTGR